MPCTSTVVPGRHLVLAVRERQQVAGGVGELFQSGIGIGELNV